MRLFNLPRTMIVLGLGLIFCALCAFTWEGELDPNEFDKWKVISVQPTRQGTFWMFVKNPDQASPVDIVAMAVDLNFTLLGYRYFKGGEPYSYVFDGAKGEEGGYVKHKFTEEQRKTCMSCHENKVVSKVAI